MENDDAARLFALEWLVQRLAKENCLEKPDPVRAAQELVEVARRFGRDLIEYSEQKDPGDVETRLVTTQFATALVALVEPIPADVQASL